MAAGGVKLLFATANLNKLAELRTAARNNRREVRALATEVIESRERTPEEIVQAIRLRENR